MQNTAQTVHKQETKSILLVKSQPNSRLTSFPSSSNNYSSPHTPALEVSGANEKQRHILKRNGYSIHLIDSFKQRIKANTLIKRMYAARGYNTEMVTSFSHNSNQIAFSASVGEIIVGTVTLGIDSDKGLLADGLYRQEIDAYRIKNRKICELSKFALDPKYSTKEMIASLFQVAYLYARDVHKVTDFFCEVNPRHAVPQKCMFGFRQIGDLRNCPRVDAPAVLLHLEFEYIRKQIFSLKASDNRKERSIYPYFLSEHEEKILTNKIVYNNLLHGINDRYTSLRISHTFGEKI